MMTELLFSGFVGPVFRAPHPLRPELVLYKAQNRHRFQEHPTVT